MPEFSWQDPVDAWSKERHTKRAKAFAAFVDEQIDLVPGVLMGTDAKTKVAAAEWFRLYPHLAPPLAPMLVEWAFSPAKTVRVAATNLIGQLGEPARDQSLLAAIEQGPAGRLGGG